jgi:hypothetical protein
MTGSWATLYCAHSSRVIAAAVQHDTLTGPVALLRRTRHCRPGPGGQLQFNDRNQILLHCLPVLVESACSMEVRGLLLCIDHVAAATDFESGVGCQGAAQPGSSCQRSFEAADRVLQPKSCPAIPSRRATPATQRCYTEAGHTCEPALWVLSALALSVFLNTPLTGIRSLLWCSRL